MCVKCLVHRKFWIPGASIFTMMNSKHTQRRQGRMILSSAPRARGVVRGTGGCSMDHPAGGELEPWP